MYNKLIDLSMNVCMCVYVHLFICIIYILLYV